MLNQRAKRVGQPSCSRARARARALARGSIRSDCRFDHACGIATFPGSVKSRTSTSSWSNTPNPAAIEVVAWLEITERLEKGDRVSIRDETRARARTSYLGSSVDSRARARARARAREDVPSRELLYVPLPLPLPLPDYAA